MSRAQAACTHSGLLRPISVTKMRKMQHALGRGITAVTASNSGRRIPLSVWPVGFTTDPDPDLMTWECAKTNESGSDPDLRSCDQPLIHVIYRLLSKKCNHDFFFNILVFSICSLALILHGFQTTQFPHIQTFQKFPLPFWILHSTTSREGSLRSEIRIRICANKQTKGFRVRNCF